MHSRLSGSTGEQVTRDPVLTPRHSVSLPVLGPVLDLLRRGLTTTRARVQAIESYSLLIHNAG